MDFDNGVCYVNLIFLKQTFIQSKIISVIYES